MRFPEVVKMADDASAPVWARSKKSGGGLGGVFGFLMVILALFGVLIIVFRFMDGSFANAGGRVDGWVHSAVSMVHKDTPKVEAKAAAAADTAADATKAAGATVAKDADKAGDAVKKAADGQPAKK
jgi:predicted lipid-binding transport protein (Tim44 family)